MKVTGIFRIKGRGWVITVNYPANQETPNIGDHVTEDGQYIGEVAGVECFYKGFNRGEEIGIVLRTDKTPKCKDVQFGWDNVR